MLYWNLEHIICISNTSVILHNFIACMQQNGLFRAEAAGPNIVMKVYEHERLTNLQSRTKFESNITQLDPKICHYVDEDADRNMCR